MNSVIQFKNLIPAFIFFQVNYSLCIADTLSHTPGESIFFDNNLSINKNQSCAVCHGEKVGWTGPDELINKKGGVYEGSLHDHFGNRKPPSSAYASVIPLFDYNTNKKFYGGAFWDGRATGWKLGNATADQAQGPPLNPLEQALKSKEEVSKIILASTYSKAFTKEWNLKGCTDTNRIFDNMARSILKFESSERVNRYSSKYDRVINRTATFTSDEQRGLDLFSGKARCTQCHVLDNSSKGPAIFSDFTYHNIGIPANPENPFYHMDTVCIDGKPVNPDGKMWIDSGLGGFLRKLSLSDDWRKEPRVTTSIKGMSNDQLNEYAVLNIGKHRVPTLRNVDKRPGNAFVKAYTHNGYFKSLSTLVHYYNTRDILPRCNSIVSDSAALKSGCWPEPEVKVNLNKEIGDLKLTDQEEKDLVSFLKTLSDQ
jgi:cytochrome c peroxidase